MSKQDNYTFVEYNEYLNTLTQNAKTVKLILEKDEDKKINEILNYLASKNMYIPKEQLTQTFVLNYLAEYVRQDEERIKSLPKSKVKTPKSYSIY